MVLHGRLKDPQDLGLLGREPRVEDHTWTQDLVVQPPQGSCIGAESRELLAASWRSLIRDRALGSELSLAEAL